MQAQARLQQVRPLETARLLVRPFSREDADLAFLVDLMNDPGWLQFIGDRGIRSALDASNYLQNGPLAMYEKHGVGLMAVQRREDGAMVGMCGLIRRDTLPDVDLGYALLTQYTGKGYALEASTAVLDYGHDVLHLHRIVAFTALENPRSVSLLEKLGFQFDSVIDYPEGKQSRFFVHECASP
jgi:ribosomal-protein-alanine N-acetyltransferase